MHGIVLSESKLEDLHTRKPEMVHHLSDIRCNRTEILRNNRKVGKVLFRVFRKSFAGAFTHRPLIAVFSPAGISQ